MKTTAVIHSYFIITITLAQRMVTPLDSLNTLPQEVWGRQVARSLLPQGVHLGRFNTWADVWASEEAVERVPGAGACGEICKMPQNRVESCRLRMTQTHTCVSAVRTPPLSLSLCGFLHHSCELITEDQSYEVCKFPVGKGMADNWHGTLLKLSLGKTQK